MAKDRFRDLLIPMKPTESTPPTTTTSRKSVISFRETFFIPLLRFYLFFFLLFCLDYFLPFDLRGVVLSAYLCCMLLRVFDVMFRTTVPMLKKLVSFVKNRGEPLKRERITESILSRDDAETPSLAFLAHISVHISVHMGILLLLFSLPSPRHYIITSFDPPLFVLDGLLFSYYCLIGLSLHLSVQILSNFMKPMLETLAISLTNKVIISVSSKFESGKNWEQEPLVDFDSTNNRACQSGLLVSNSDKTTAREASKGPCMTEGALSLVDSMTRISSTDFEAPDNSAHLVRANQSGPIMLNSEKNYTSEGLIGECLTESVISFRETFFIPLLRWYLFFFLLFCLDYFLPFDLRGVVLSAYLCCMLLRVFDVMFRTTVPMLKKLVSFVKNRGEPLKRERITESILSRDDAETPSLAFLAHISVELGILLLLLSLPSPRHFITSFDPPLFVLDGLLFSYYCLIGLSLHLTVPNLKKFMKPMLKTPAISLKNKGIISVSSKFESGKNREPKPLVEKHRAEDEEKWVWKELELWMRNEEEEKRRAEEEEKRMRKSAELRMGMRMRDGDEDEGEEKRRAEEEAKRRAEETKEKEKRIYLESLLENAVPVYDSDKTNAKEASKRPCTTEGVPSLVHSTTRISTTDFDAPDNSAHLVRANQSGPIMLNSEKKHTSEGLIGECLTESVLSLDDSTKRKSFPDFDATENEAHLVRAYQSGPVVSLSENKNQGEALKSFRAIFDPELHTTDSVTWKSFEVLETLRPREQQSNATDTDQERQIQTQMCNELSDACGGRPDAAAKSFRGRLTLEGCVQQEKSPDLTRVMQFNGVEQRVTKMPRYLGGLTAQSASSSCGPIGLPNGGHIVLLDELDQSTKNIEHVATADQCSPTLSLPEKKMVRKTLNRNCITMSVIFEEKHQRFVRRCEGATKSLGAMCISRKHGINQVSMVEPIHKQRGIHQWPFLRSAVGLPDGGHILSLLEKKIVRKTLKRKCRSISVLSLEDHKQHVDRRWEDAAKSHGTKRIRMQLVIHRLSTAKCTHKQHGIHQWPFQRSAIGLSDGGHILSLSEKKIVRKTLKRKCRSISVLSLVDRQRHVDRRWEDAAKNIGAKRICRQLVIHRVSIAKRVCRQHGIHHRWPFERDWATKKGYSLGDERPVEVISLSTHVELVSRLQLIYISWLGRFSPRPSALPRGILIVGPIALSSSEFAATNNLAQRGGQDQRGSGASGSENERTREQEDPRQDQRGSGASGSGNERTRKQKDPKEIRNTSISITKDDLLPLQGRMTKKEAAAYLGVSESTVKRIWKDCNMGEWDNGRRKVWKPPDQYGEGNTSTARETPSHHVQTGMGGEPVGQNQEANVLRQDFMGGPIALNIESGLIMVARPPDQDGEKNTSTACEVPSHNVETGMEIEPVGQNQEANVFRRDFTEDPTALNTENGLIIGSSSEWASQVNDQSTTPYQNHNALLFPQPQVTSMLSENRGGSIDWRNSFASQTEPFSDTHISGSSNLAFPTWSDQAALSQHAEGQSVLSTVYPHHNAVHRFPEVWRPPDQLEGQTMQFTAHPNPNAPGLPQFQIASSQVLSANEAPSQPVATILTERQDPRSVMVKATYGNGNRMIKFPLPLTSGIKELMQEVSKTLDWELGSFDVYFEDGDRDWVLMARDDNVRDYQQLQLLNSLVNQATKLEVCKKVPDTTNICETCGSLKQQRP